MQALKTLRKNLPASVPIVGCGGISGGSDALEYAANGASMVQLYTSFSYDGVGFPRRIKDEIDESLKASKTSWAGLVSSSVEALSLKPQRPEDIFKKQAEELKATLDQAGQALGDTVASIKEKVKDVLPDRGGVTSGSPGAEKSLQALIKEAEAALGITSTQ